MKAKKYIVSLLLLVLAWSTVAQELGFNVDGLSLESNRLGGKIMGEIFYISALANSNFLYPDEWVDGEITLTDGDKYENVKLRYHAEDDELIAYNEKNKSLYFVEKEQVSAFVMIVGEQERKFIKGYPKGEDKKGKYFEELYVGNQMFLSDTHVYEQKVSPFKDELGIMRDVEYYFRSDYFRYSEKEGYHKMGINRRALITAFPEHKKAIKKLLRKNNIFIDSEQDMVRAFSLLDENHLLQ